MANYNFGIDCETRKSAKALEKYVASLDIYQDGLDRQDERVSIISKQSLKDELKRYATAAKVLLRVEIWPEDVEYDDAESDASLEIITYGITKPEKASAVKGPISLKAYCGDKEKRDEFKQWIQSENIPGLAVTGGWDAEGEFGSWGVEFQSDDPATQKAINQVWLKRGVVTEKIKK